MFYSDRSLFVQGLGMRFYITAGAGLLSWLPRLFCLWKIAALQNVLPAPIAKFPVVEQQGIGSQGIEIASPFAREIAKSGQNSREFPANSLLIRDRAPETGSQWNASTATSHCLNCRFYQNGLPTHNCTHIHTVCAFCE